LLSCKLRRKKAWVHRYYAIFKEPSHLGDMKNLLETKWKVDVNSEQRYAVFNHLNPCEYWEKTADLQAHRLQGCNALWACSLAIFGEEIWCWGKKGVNLVYRV
jgi:hypothetical protein